MARVRDKGLFGYLKDRKIFVQGGQRTLREALTARETQEQNKLAARKVRKKKK